MSLVVAAVLSFLFLEPPWRYLVLLPFAAWEAFQVTLWMKSRKGRSTTGREALVGTFGRALTDCRPHGQVWVKGESWSATCPAGVDEGDDIVVEGISGLTLTVAPRRPAGQTAL